MSSKENEAPKKIAAIDIGTITMLMLVAETAPSSVAAATTTGFSKKRKIIKVIENHIEYPKLGEGVHQNRKFSDQAMTRARGIFHKYTEICKTLHVDKIIALGTSASRDSSNSKKFYEEITKETGIMVQIIDGETEARLSFLGGLLDAQDPATHALMDIGGGSTEFVCLNDAATDIEGQSLDIGSIRATEMFLKNDPYDKQSLINLNQGLKKFWETLKPSLQEKLKTKIWVAVAGTPTVLAAMKHMISSFTSEKIDGTSISRSEAFHLYESLAAMTKLQREQIPLIGKQRADTIVAGAAIFATAMEFFGKDEIFISTRGLRHGVLVSGFSH